MQYNTIDTIALQTSQATFINVSESASGRGAEPRQPDTGARSSGPSSDSVTLSPEARQSSQPADTTPNASNLSASQLQQLQKLKSRDLEVRTHEQAHLAAAGQYAASGANFTYQKGPDGKNYAIGGEVQIDISKENSPEETLRKMEVISRAALAPSSPSSADRQIAARAAMTAAQARMEISSANREKDASKSSSSESDDAPGNSRIAAGSERLDSPGTDQLSQRERVARTYQAIQDLR